MINWKEFGRKRPWTNFMYYPNIYEEGLRKTTETSVRVGDVSGGIPTGI
jgi:hypothetical protein